MDQFSKTRRGIDFFDRDLPNLNKQLERIAIALEKKNTINEKFLLLEKRRIDLISEGRSTDFRDNQVDFRNK